MAKLVCACSRISIVPFIPFISFLQEYIAAVLRETLRLCTIIPRFSKRVTKDTTIKARRFKRCAETGKIANVEEFDVPLVEGDVVLVDISGVHMNRMSLTSLLSFCFLPPDYRAFCPTAIHWGEDVNEFRPERFIDTETYRWPRDACTSVSIYLLTCVFDNPLFSLSRTCS